MAGLSNKTLLWKLYLWIDFENELFYCFFALSTMEKYLVESLHDNLSPFKMHDARLL